MRICVVSRRNATRDPRTRALLFSLHGVGHEVTVVCGGTPQSGLPDGVEVRIVAARRPQGGGRRGRMLRRIQPAALRRRLYDAALRREVAAATPDLVYPQRPDDIDLAAAVAVPMMRRPEWPDAGTGEDDLIALAPHAPEWSRSPAGPSAPFHLPGDDRPPTHPEPGRHAGTSVAIAYRVTPTNPGRYLEAALRRSETKVTVLDGVLDWRRVPAGTAAVVIVESPYPALEVIGTNPGIPVLFWAHHGEHHLATNLRLTRRYGAHAVLLAHSWHLAHRFPVPVHRFPFGIATELTGDPAPWKARHHDVAMIGAGVNAVGDRYQRRRQIVAALEAALPGRTVFTDGVSPEEMAALYGDTRMVTNDGGTRHFPITMRVFEALSAGALLVTEDLPGTEVLLRRGEHYVPLADDVAAQARALLASPESPAIAAAGREHALGHHTYDHRVDELLSIAAGVDPEVTSPPAEAALSPLAALVDEDVDVQDLAVFGVDGSLGLHDRVVRSGDAALERLRERSVDAVVIGRGGAADLARAVGASRGYIYAAEPHVAAVEAILAETRPEATVTVDGGLLRADLGTGYRIRSAGHPLAT